MVEILVTTGNDVVNPNDGVTSLREALGIANTDPNPDADTIRFGPSISTVALDAGINWGGTPLTIIGDRNGDGISEVTISQSAAAFAGPIVPIFVMDTGTLRLETLRFADIWVDGRAGPGAFPDGRDASVILNGGNLTLDRVVFEQVTVIGGPGAQGTTGGSGIAGNNGPFGGDGGDGTNAAAGETGGAGGTASLVQNGASGVLTLDQVGLTETVALFGGAGGRGGTGGTGGNGGNGGDSADIFSDAGDGGNGGAAGNGGQGGRGGFALTINNAGPTVGGTGLADGSTKSAGMGGAGGLQGAGGLPGQGGDAEFGSDGSDGLFGLFGFAGPAGDIGFEGLGAVSTPVSPTLVYYQPVDVDVSEGESIVFRFNRIGDTRGEIDVAYTIGLGGAGFDGDDIFGAETGTVRLAPGSLTFARSFLAEDDATVEALETFTLFINSTLYGPLQGPGIMTTLFSGPGSIAASDTAVSLSPIRLFAQEGEDIEFGLQRTGVAQDFTVSYRLTPEGGLGLDDFEPGTALEGTVDFTAAGPDFQRVAFRSLADGIPEGSESFSVEIAGVTGGNGTDTITPFTAPAGGQLSDVEPDVVIDLVAVSPLVIEGGSIVFDITRTGATSDMFDVPWTLTPGNGLDLSDFVAGTSLSGSVGFDLFGPNSLRVTLETLDDTDVEATETFDVSLGQIINSGVGGSLIVPGASQFFGEVGDNDVTPDRLAIAALQADRAEGDTGSTPFTFSVTRVGDLAGTVTVDFAVSGAVDAADFAGSTLPGGTLAFGPGQSTQTLTLEVSGDMMVEPDEGFDVTFSNATGNAVLETGSASGTIRNDDAGSGENRPPEAADDAAQTRSNRPAIIDVLANDGDPDGDGLAVSAIGAGVTALGGPASGTVGLQQGRAVYTPDPGFVGSDSFLYRVTDGRGGSDTARVTVEVAPALAPERETGVIRGTDRDDLIAIRQNAIYLGREAEDTYLISQAARDDSVSVIDDRGINRIQIVDGLAIAESIVISGAIGLTLGNGAVVQILDAESFIFDIGGNDTTGAEGRLESFDAFVRTTLQIPPGQSAGGPVVIEADPVFALEADDFG